MANRYEIMPFGGAEQEAATVPRPLVLTVTCSPRHGVDRGVELALRLAALGHDAVVHLAARMIRGPEHLDAVLESLAAAGLEDVFVIAGDAQAPLGPYTSALELLPLIAVHPARPRRLGIAAYPEGHPLIEPAVLEDALIRKARLADYMVTQLCFDPPGLLTWIERTRASGVDLPLYVGLPGMVDRRRLLEVSLRVGVGASVAFLRKQQGLRRLLGRPGSAADRLHEVFAPLVGDARLRIAGLHYFTFNRLRATLAWEAGTEAGGLAAGDG
jgi:methylenetetrahydrofolate reductase (NADPH)